MCGGGGYAGMTKNLLVSLGWDENKIYNTCGCNRCAVCRSDSGIQTAFKEIYTAVCDFANDFVKYSKITDCKCKISGEDALSLYLSGIERLKNITQE